MSFGNIKTSKIGIKNDLCLFLHFEKEWNVDTCWGSLYVEEQMFVQTNDFYFSLQT